MNLLGYSINKVEKNLEKNKETFSVKKQEDGSVEVETGSDFYGLNKYILNLESEFETEKQRVNAYRKASEMPEISIAVDDIVNDAIVSGEAGNITDLNLDDTEFSDNIKKNILEEWENILNLFSYQKNVQKMFRRWYIDGKIYYHKVVGKNIKEGIVELRYLDPRRIKKVVEHKKDDDGKVLETKEYFVYSLSDPNKKETNYGNRKNALEIQPDMISFSHSGLSVDGSSVIESYLQKALKPLNQLMNLEDSLIVYRVSRAPERRIFYIDVGNLPKTRAEQYISSIIGKYKNKITYDATSGSFTNNKNQMSMLEDIWLPRREGSRGTEVTTLPGGQNLGDLDDVLYFKTKLMKSLHIPLSRMETDTPFSSGRSSEITRDEIKFGKFISKIQSQFGEILLDTLKTQLLLKNVITTEDWEKELNNISLLFTVDSHFSELKKIEIMNDRLDSLEKIKEYVGTYFSHEYIMKNILRMTNEDIEQNKKEIIAGKKDGSIKDKEEDI